MDNCIAACGCDNYEGITQSDLDRFTDCIENVLNDEKGRRLFRNFMYTSKMHAGRRILDFWEHTERLIGYNGNSESLSYPSYLRDVDRLIDDADRVDEIDFAAVERLTIARDSMIREDITEALKIIKQVATKALRREYNKFRERFVPAS
ncbi:uncharacterized protein LOC142975081 [Anticarsia gemmatalis]|uniref:uncharacterized protein LOC142975081 n=1 Tax=Anticarsia gemmatalis TaxID=129554 RepID=UPI003F776697